MTDQSGDMQYVTLCLGEEVFAVPVALVREILDYRETFHIPDGPKFLLGLIDVRGRGTPVIDLRTKLGLMPIAPTPTSRMIVLDVPLKDRVLALCLVADKVLEVTTFALAQIEAAPDIGVPWRSYYIDGVVRRESGFVVLFNLAKLLTSVELAAVNSSVLEAA